AREIKDAVRRSRRGIAPRMLALALRRSKRRPLEFRFARQPRVAPARKRQRFRVADVHRPRERQRDQLEHAAPVPPVVVTLPEKRMGDWTGMDPPPVVGAPPALVAVAAGLDEFQKLLVRDVVPLDRKRR